MAIYSSLSGQVEAYHQYNLGNEVIKETGNSKVSGPENLEPLYDAYFDHSSEDFKIIEMRK